MRRKGLPVAPSFRCLPLHGKDGCCAATLHPLPRLSPAVRARYRNRTAEPVSARPFDRSPRPASRDGIPSLTELP